MFKQSGNFQYWTPELWVAFLWRYHPSRNQAYRDRYWWALRCYSLWKMSKRVNLLVSINFFAFASPISYSPQCFSYFCWRGWPYWSFFLNKSIFTVGCITGEICDRPFSILPFDSYLGIFFYGLALVFREHSLKIFNFIVIALWFFFG